MADRTAPPTIASDPGLPGARGLFTGDGARTVAFFLEERGWTADAVAAVQAVYRPGRSCRVRYRATSSGPRGRRTFSICAETRKHPRRALPAPDAFAERFDLEDPLSDGSPYLVWAFPYDPALRDLPEAGWGPDVGDAIGAIGRRPRAVSVQALRYRPTRRAVFRYRVLQDGGWETSYGKVLPADKAARVLGLTGALKGRRTPPLALASGATGEQSLLFPVLRGRSLRDLLVGGGSLPAPERVARLPEDLDASVEWTLAGPDRPAHTETARHAGELARVLVPEVSAEVDRVTDAVEAGAAADDVPRRVIHGDLYEAQVFVGEDFSLGLVDLDDLGPGDPAMDAANFCAHLLALALAVPAAGDRLVAYRRLVRAAFLTRLGISPPDLAWREALAMLLLAAGPFRVLDPGWPAEVGRRVRLAVRFLEEENAA